MLVHDNVYILWSVFVLCRSVFFSIFQCLATYTSYGSYLNILLTHNFLKIILLMYRIQPTYKHSIRCYTFKFDNG